MIRILCVLLLVAGLLLLFTAPANADVSYEGIWIAFTFALVVLFLPVFIIAIITRTKKKLYLAVSTLWAVAAFVYLWLSGGAQNEFILISSASYLILGIYVLKEKKSA